MIVSSDLKHLAQNMFEKALRQLRVSKMDVANAKSNATMWKLLCGQLDYLRINFLVERLLTERGNANKHDLFELAKEMLDLIIFLCLERDRTA